MLAFLYDYDPRGLVTEREVRTDEATTVTEYAHDALRRLTSSTTGEYVATYAWDAASNLVGETVSDNLATNLADDGHVVSRTVDEVNRVTAVVTDFGQWPAVQTTTVSLAYDERGNRIGEETTRTTGGTTHVLNRVDYTFDGADRLVRTHDSGANQNNAKDDTVTTWTRDGLGRALTVTENAAVRARVFDGLDAVVDGPVRLTRGPGGAALFEAFEQVEGHGRNATTVTVTRDALADVLGSTTSIATDGLVSADLALFADFGDLATGPTWATSTGFTGHTTAGGVLEFAARSYDPATRVWTSVDPFGGSVTRSASTNGYAYVEGAPESFVDVLGFAAAQAAMLESLGLSAAEAAYLVDLAGYYRALDAAQRMRDEILRARLAELDALSAANEAANAPSFWDNVGEGWSLASHGVVNFGSGVVNFASSTVNLVVDVTANASRPWCLPGAFGFDGGPRAGCWDVPDIPPIPVWGDPDLYTSSQQVGYWTGAAVTAVATAGIGTGGSVPATLRNLVQPVTSLVNVLRNPATTIRNLATTLREALSRPGPTNTLTRTPPVSPTPPVGAGATAASTADAAAGAAASPVDEITAAIQRHVAQAVDDFDNGVIRVSPAQRAAGVDNPALLEAARGSVIGERARESMALDPALSDLWLTRPGQYGPDIVDLGGQRWWDITTPQQWQAHLDKYSEGFGTGIGIFTR